MNRIAPVCALMCVAALLGCNKSDVAPQSSSAPNAIVVATPAAAQPASSPASDPSLPDASRALSVPASSASGS
ncbi:MAG: hypothetical protein ABI433_04200 [Burkholderiaceae bacterium]